MRMSETIEQVQTTRKIDASAIYTKLDLCLLLGVTKRCIDKRIARRELPKPARHVGRDPIWSGKELARWFGVEVAS